MALRSSRPGGQPTGSGQLDRSTGRPVGASATEALLQRASAQLKGQRVANASSEGKDAELEAYLNTLSRKPTIEPQWDKFDAPDGSILPSDSPRVPLPAPSVGPTGSMFLKKKPVSDSTNQDAPSRPVTYGAREGKTRSSSGDRVQALTQKYGKGGGVGEGANRVGGGARVSALMSDSDGDLSLSLDEEVLHDVAKLKKQNNQKPSEPKLEPGRKSSSAPSIKSQVTVVRAKSKSPVAISDNDDSSPRQGRGNQFLKKKPAGTAPVADAPEIPEVREKKKSPKTDKNQPAPVVLRSVQKGRGGRGDNVGGAIPLLDTDEESLAEFIGGLSSASSGGKTPRHRGKGSSKSPRRPRALSLEYAPPEQELVHYEESVSEAESDNFKINVQDIDSLDLIDDSPPLTKPSFHPPSTFPSKKSPSHPPSSSSHDSKSPRSKSHGRGSKSPRNKPSVSKSKAPSSRGAWGGVTAPPVKSIDPILSQFGLRSVDEFLDDDLDDLRIPEALDESDYDVTPHVAGGSNARGGNAGSPRPPLRSILSPTPRSMTPRSSRSRVRLMDELIEVRSRSPSPDPVLTERGAGGGRRTGGGRGSHRRGSDGSSVRTESVDSEEVDSRTVSDAESVTPRVESDTEAASTVRSDSESELGQVGRRSSSRSSMISEPLYSNDFTGGGDTGVTSPAQSGGSSSEGEGRRSWSSLSPRSSRRGVKTRDHGAQTGLDTAGGLQYHWTVSGAEREAAAGVQYGLSFVDPASVAATVVSADTLEALTAYSPAALALNDMLRMQLSLTTQFLHTQRRLHAALIQSIGEPSFTYTTLRDTKEYIRQHRRPPLTFDEALRQVNEEMGLS